jgi:hypothetical protein
MDLFSCPALLPSPSSPIIFPFLSAPIRPLSSAVDLLFHAPSRRNAVVSLLSAEVLSRFALALAPIIINPTDFLSAHLCGINVIQEGRTTTVRCAGSSLPAAT